MPTPPRRLVVGWLALALLLAANIAAAFLAGGLTTLITLGVAGAMAAIVLIVFMELGQRLSLYWVFGGAGFFWLAILISLTATDYLTRVGFSPR